MARDIEKLLLEIDRKLDLILSHERLVPIEKFCKDKGYDRRQIDHLREKYPQIWKGIGGNEVDRKGRTIWRNIQIDTVAFNALFTSPIESGRISNKKPVTDHQLDYIAKQVAAMLQPKEEEPELMSFSEIREKRQISYGTLTRWIEQTGLKTYQFGRGKAIKRTDYRKLP